MFLRVIFILWQNKSVCSRIFWTWNIFVVKNIFRKISKIFFFWISAPFEGRRGCPAILNSIQSFFIPLRCDSWFKKFSEYVEWSETNAKQISKLLGIFLYSYILFSSYKDFKLITKIKYQPFLEVKRGGGGCYKRAFYYSRCASKVFLLQQMCYKSASITSDVLQKCFYYSRCATKVLSITADVLQKCFLYSRRATKVISIAEDVLQKCFDYSRRATKVLKNWEIIIT